MPALHPSLRLPGEGISNSGHVMIDVVPSRTQAGLGHLLNRGAVVLAYADGIVVSAIGVISVGKGGPA